MWALCIGSYPNLWLSFLPLISTPKKGNQESFQCSVLLWNESIPFQKEHGCLSAFTPARKTQDVGANGCMSGKDSQRVQPLPSLRLYLSGPPYSVHQEMGENDMQGFIFSLITCFSTSQSWRFFCEMKFGEKTGCTTVLVWLSLQSSGGACGPVTPQEETELGSVSTAGSQEGAGPCSHISELQATFQLPSASQKDVHLSKEHQDRANNTQNRGWGI